MAYQTGTVTGADALVATASTWLQANGWTLLDTLASDDLVFQSTGSSGKFPMIMRLSSSARTTNNPLKDPTHPNVCVPHVEVRGYHTWSTSLSTPTGISLTTTTTNGLLAAATYYYRVSALGASGETLASAEQSITTTGTTSYVTISWGQVAGAVGYKVYGRSTGAELLLQTIWGGNSTSWIDTGVKTPSGALPGSNTAHGGTNEYGLLGTSVLGESTAGTPTNLFLNTRLDSANGPAIPNNPALSAWAPVTQNSTNNAGPYRYLGDRLAVCPAPNSPNAFKFVDLATGENWTSAVNPSGLGCSVINCWEAVYDSTNDKWVIYYLSSTNFTAADGFWKYDIDTDAHSRCASVPWTSTASSGFVLWDGADTLYIAQGNNTTNFYKYSIAGNTYTTLAVAPVARSTANYAPGSSTQGTGQYQIYVPASASGLSTDVIYCILSDNTTTIYCYSVTSNTWPTSGTPSSISSPINSTSSEFFLWDGVASLFMRRADQTQCYRAVVGNITTGLSNFSQNGQVWDTTESTYGVEILNHVIGKVRVHPSNASTYYFIGTQDGVFIVTNCGNLGHYYWMYFGRCSTRRRSQIMTTTTSSYGPGTNVAMTVDSSTGYVAGDKVLVFDPATGNLEQTTVYSVSSATSVAMTLAKSYGVGSIIGVDPFQTVITSDSGFAGAPADQKGYKTDLEQAWYFSVPMGWGVGTNQYSVATTTVASPYNLFNATSPDGNGYYQPTEPLLFWSTPLDLSNAVYPISRKGLYGTVPNQYFLPYLNSTSGPQAGDTIPVAGHNYLFFNQRTTLTNPSWKLGVVLGPIS